MWYFLIFILIISVLLIVPFFFNINSRYKNEIKAKEIEEESAKYHEEKSKKLLDHYYRAIEFKQKYNTKSQNYNIVGFAEVKGKWTKMVMKQNMQYLSTLKNLMGNNFSKAGIWQLKVKAQNLISNAFHKGRGR